MSGPGGSQVVVTKRPVEWTFPDKDGPVRIFYDAGHESLIFLTERAVHVSRKGGNSLAKHDMRIGNHLEVRNAAFSLDRLYLGLQISSVEIKVLDLRGSLMALQSCRNTDSGTHMWNFYWVKSKCADIVLVTSNGIELYKMNANTRALRCTKTFRYDTIHHFALPSHQFFLLLNSDLVFQGLRINDRSPEKLNKFEILGVEKSSHDERGGFYSQITLHDFYGSVCCIFVDEVKAKLYLFRLQKETKDKQTKYKMTLTNQWNLLNRGSYRISSVDNVLLAHNINSEVTLPMLFNLNHAEGRCLEGPLPIIARFPNDKGEVVPKRLEFEGKIQYKPPKFLLEAWKADNEYRGRFYTLELDTQHIINNWGVASRVELLRFLCERNPEKTKPLILNYLRNMISQYCQGGRSPSDKFETISKHFFYINQVLFQAVLEAGEEARAREGDSVNIGQLTRASSRLVILPLQKYSSHAVLRTQDNLTVLTPEDIIQGVILPCRDMERIVGVTVEYIRTLHRAKLRIPYEVTEVLLDILVDRNEFYALHQLAQYHALPDDLRFAQRLLKLAAMDVASPALKQNITEHKMGDEGRRPHRSYGPAKQLAIDMLLRLNVWPPICDLLIHEGKVEIALRLFVDKWDPDEPVEGQPSAETFLQAAKDLNDPLLFHNIFTFFRDTGLFKDTLAKFQASMTQQTLGRSASGTRPRLSSEIASRNSRQTDQARNTRPSRSTMHKDSGISVESLSAPQKTMNESSPLCRPAPTLEPDMDAGKGMFGVCKPPNMARPKDHF